MLEPVTLEGLTAAADLQRRFDTKYVVPKHVANDLLGRLSSAWFALEMDGQRHQPYRSTYFDTPDLATFRAHQQRRRRRYKIRTRTYAAGQTMLELKVKDNAGRTIKYRCEHPETDPEYFSRRARAFVAEQLADSYGFDLPDRLVVSARTQYLRATVANLDVGERVTIDTGLQVQTSDQQVVFDPDYALVETKTAKGNGEVDRLLRKLGVRPLRVSKYALGIAVLNPQLPSNHWRAAMRKLHTGPTPA